jgi:hypothetical protein
MKNDRSVLRNRTSCRQIASFDISTVADGVAPGTHASNGTVSYVALSGEWPLAVATSSVRDPNFGDSSLFCSVLRVGTAADGRATNAVDFDSAGFASRVVAAGFSAGPARCAVVAAGFSVDPARCAVVAGFSAGPARCVAARAVVAEHAVDPAADVAGFAARYVVVGRVAVAKRAVDFVVAAEIFAVGIVVVAKLSVADIAAVAGPFADTAAVAGLVADTAAVAGLVADTAAAVEPAVVDSAAVVGCVAAAPAVWVPVSDLNLDVAGR